MTVIIVTRREVPASQAVSGLEFPSNNAASSDVRLEWSGANFLSRTAHTVIWKANYTQQSGYYAVTWHDHGDGSFHFDTYEFGAHPYPCDGTVGGTGQASNGTGASGTVHYYEIAGLGGSDFIATAGPGTVTQVTKGTWVTQARKCEVISGTTLRHTFYPDLSNPSVFIQQDITLASLTSPASPRFVIGCSPWTASGGANSETPSAILRGFQLYSAGLSLAQIQARMDLTTDAAVISNDPGSLFYCNLDPTPSDITDKSGAGHTPSWANANRPTLWSG